ncbi:MAG: hypothetical protein MMC23_002975 [Stictis urceolatum]|nr:hypothetical protein [Stictis urceolata]
MAKRGELSNWGRGFLIAEENEDYAVVYKRLSDPKRTIVGIEIKKVDFIVRISNPNGKDGPTGIKALPMSQSDWGFVLEHDTDDDLTTYTHLGVDWMQLRICNVKEGRACATCSVGVIGPTMSTVIFLHIRDHAFLLEAMRRVPVGAKLARVLDPRSQSDSGKESGKVTEIESPKDAEGEPDEDLWVEEPDEDLYVESNKENQIEVVLNRHRDNQQESQTEH